MDPESATALSNRRIKRALAESASEVIKGPRSARSRGAGPRFAAGRAACYQPASASVSKTRSAAITALP